MGDGKQLTGRVVLVTGGGGEIGGAIARRFSAEGAFVAVSDIRPEAAREVAEDIAGRGGKAVWFEADSSKIDDAKRIVDETVRAFGKLTTYDAGETIYRWGFI